MKIKILRNTVANKAPVEVGQIVDVPEAEATLLVGMGKAIRVDLENSPAVETADIAPAEGVRSTAKASPRKK